MRKKADSWELTITPRRWQTEALGLWLRHCRGTVGVVTGGGKTVFAELCMLKFRESFPDGRFIIVVPTISLLDQWYVSLTEELHVPDHLISCFSSEEKPEKENVVNVLVINTAREIAPIIAGQYETFLIVDECHRAGSSMNVLALRGRHRAALGLSATPERDYDDGFRQRVAPVLGDVIYRYDYEQAYRDGVVVQFELLNVKIDLLPDEQRKYARLSAQVARALRSSWSDKHRNESLRRLLQQRAAISASAAMRIPVAAKLVDINKGRRCLVFHERIGAANAILHILEKRRHSVTAYHSGIGPVIRRDNLRLFRRGVIDVLVCCRGLDEGMNIPETAVAVIASSTAAQRQRIQRLGRVLRPAPGKSHATVYTVYATDIEEKRLLEEALNMRDIASICWKKSEIMKHV
ncbi:MAG: DEAD/DEAH box helicase family protein [Chloroflexi bacterium]|nr:DEAD/DEAH box helicase family protein [Chloroflexota bacterium]